MDILFLLIPLSVLLALALMGLLAWAVFQGQFEDLDCEADRILDKPNLPEQAEKIFKTLEINQRSQECAKRSL
jgi:cbb3-type cytochrome oxidase maturation protein